MKQADLKNVTVQLDPPLLDKMDERAQALDLNRSQYMRRLVRRDLGLLTPELPVEPQLPGLTQAAA